MDPHRPRDSRAEAPTGPRPIANDDDLLDAQIRSLVGTFLPTLTPTQRERYYLISDLLAQQDRREDDKATDRRGELHELAVEAVIAHFTTPARLFRLVWRHCEDGPADAVESCCQSWVQS